MSERLSFFSKFSFLALSVLLLGAGCNPFANSPEENLKEMRQNMAEAQTVKYQADVKIKGINQQNNSENSKEKNGQQFGKFMQGPLSNAEQFNVSLSGQTALNSYTNPNSKINISASTPDSSQELKVKVRQVDGKNFIKVADLGPLQSSPVSSMLGSMIIGQWIETDQLSFTREQKSDSLTEQDKQKIKDLIKNTNFVNVVEDLGEEQVEGKTAYHYKVEADRESIEKFSQEMKKIGKNSQKDENSEFSSRLNQLKDKKFDIWIGTEDKYLYRFSAQNLSSKEDNNGTVDLTLNLSDYNSDIRVDKPENTKTFKEMMGGMFGKSDGAGQMGSDMMKDSSGSGSMNFNIKSNKDSGQKGSMNIKNKILKQKMNQ